MTHYMIKILGILQKNGTKLMFWQDVLDAGFKLPSESVIEIWKDVSRSTYLSKAIDPSHKFVLAAPFTLVKYDKHGLLFIQLRI